MDALCLLLGFVARLEGDPPMSERFIVAESSGYRITASAGQSGKERLITEVMVLDRAYCHRVVWSSLTTPTTTTKRRFQVNKKGQPPIWRSKQETGTARLWPLEKRREYAAALAAELNREDAE